MITWMRHPHSEAIVDVPFPETQESTSWTCPFTRTRSRTTTRISCPTQTLALRPVEKSELHERVTKETEIRQETQSEIVTLIAKNAPAIKLAVNRLNGLLADVDLNVQSIDGNTQLGHADPEQWSCLRLCSSTVLKTFQLCNRVCDPQRKLYRKQRLFHRSDTLTKLWVCQLCGNASTDHPDRTEDDGRVSDSTT